MERAVEMNTPTKQVRSSPEAFSDLESRLTEFDAHGRVPSISLLLWFLTTVFRLDQVEAEDAVCDSPGDAGFDAIVCDDVSEEIVVFQAKRREKLPATLGDTDLKEFVGSLKQLKSEASAIRLMTETTNADLRWLLEEFRIPEKISKGYKIRAIFVANVAANRDAHSFMSHATGDGTILELWDLERLQPILNQLRRDWFVPEKATLEIDPDRLFRIGDVKSRPDLVYAAIRARQLVRLPGIDDSRVFAQNVRLGLGSTRVNDELLKSVRDKKEHGDFVTFHNGLTIVAKGISLRGKTLTLEDFSVCNGCQSLLTFFANKSKLTEELQVLVRIVKVGSERRLPEIIAYRTNNQNPIVLRDLCSNDTTQVRLKAEFDELFGDRMEYAIKRGEHGDSEELPNELAGRLLLAMYVGEPWCSHQKYRVFGDLEGRIFSYRIGPGNIRLAQLMYSVIPPCLGAMTNQRMAKYGLTSFLLLYLIAQILRQSEDGRNLLDDPIPFLSTRGKVNPFEEYALSQAVIICQWCVTELNYVVDEGGDSFDYKRSFKSAKDVEAIRDTLLKAFKKDIHRNRASHFVKPE